MAYQKQSWNDGSAGGTPINATRLEHMEDGIEQASYSTAYSTSEIDTKNTWIDGKTIYRRVLTGTKVSGTDLNISASWASSIDTLITLTGTMKAPNTDYSYPIQRYESSSIWSLVNINRNTGQVRVSSATGNYSNGNVVIIVEYTKTS